MGEKYSEKYYIWKRKFIALLQSALYYIFWIFSVKKNKIAFCTFEGGGGFGCSPKYIAEELIRRSGKYEMVWIVNDISKPFPDTIKKVKNTIINRTYHLATAKVWIDNSRKPYGTKKRKSQLYIQTWHATICIKPIGLYRGELLPEMARLVSAYDSTLIDYVLSGSDWCDNMYPKGLIYNGKILRTGTPRCDVLLNSRDVLYSAVRKMYKLPIQCKILLYAPTFRGGSQLGQREVMDDKQSIDFMSLLSALEFRFGGSWFIMLRLHPQLAAKMSKTKNSRNLNKLIDVSQHPDMNELIAACDAFLTDYSSAAFEAALINIPVFIFADDLDEYINDRGKLMFDILSLPYSVAKDNETLIYNIKIFDEQIYCEKNGVFMSGLGIAEDGCASAKTADLVERHIY